MPIVAQQRLIDRPAEVVANMEMPVILLLVANMEIGAQLQLIVVVVANMEMFVVEVVAAVNREILEVSAVHHAMIHPLLLFEYYYPM